MVRFFIIYWSSGYEKVLKSAIFFWHFRLRSAIWASSIALACTKILAMAEYSSELEFCSFGLTKSLICLFRKSRSCTDKSGTIFANSRTCAHKSPGCEEDFTRCRAGQARRFCHAEYAAICFEHALYVRVYTYLFLRKSIQILHTERVSSWFSAFLVWRVGF